ncbi:polyketide cyclase [Streptomyces longispororuber]|uniref:Polyketide cyclase n=1 Tax=Streptomyces longispororuber TaxID=68230 RepID=A0A919DNJ9_9ACTN|nr:SRPBCC family protein [Streptomyces longispororuber]GHE60439.1 polyketide cyclase [Streptomyces longispororuber]
MTTTSPASRHLSTRIARPAQEVYAYAADPSRWPEWARGLADSLVPAGGSDGVWVGESPVLGRVTVAFAERNAFGVLDHDVTLPSGEVVHNPLRVLRDGDGCEVVFTLRRRPGTSDEDFRRDADAVLADLTVLKRVAERPGGPGPR